MTDHHKAREIAAALTEGQRRAIVQTRLTVDGRALVPASRFFDDLWPSEIVRYYSAELDALSELGLAVRAVLMEGEG